MREGLERLWEYWSPWRGVGNDVFLGMLERAVAAAKTGDKVLVFILAGRS